MAQLKPTDIPKDWLAAQYEDYAIGDIARNIEKGYAPVPDDRTEAVSRTTVARAMSLYGLYADEERHKNESWLRSLYQENTAAEGYAGIDDLVEITQGTDELLGVSSYTIGTWLETYDITKGRQIDNEIPRTDELDWEYFYERYIEDELTLSELAAEVDEKTAETISVDLHTVRDHLDWLGIEIRDANAKAEFTPVENVDQYLLDHHYRVRAIEEAAPVTVTSRRVEEWKEVNDHLTHWDGSSVLPDEEILYDPAGLATAYERYAEDTQSPIRHLSIELGIAPAAVELALVFHGIRDELAFVAIDDPAVVEDVPRQRHGLLADRGAYAVLRLTFELEIEEIAASLNVCEGLVKFAEQVHDLPYETAVGRPTEGHRGQLHDPRYIRQQLTNMSIPELAAEHGYASTTPLEQLLDAFELKRPTTIPVPELDCNVRSNPEKHVGKLLAALTTEHPEITVRYETASIQIDISEFGCAKDAKQYTPDFTVETDQKVFHVEVKGRVDNGEVHGHLITDREKAKAMMGAMSDRNAEEYIVITNGANLKHYDYEFSFAECFDSTASFESHDRILERPEEFRSLIMK